MLFRHYQTEDYASLCDFLIELSRDDKQHINWNWARFEWMAEHPEFDKSAVGSIGLWNDNERIVGAAIYDMYFGEAFCGVLPGYDDLYPKVLDYAYRELKDDSGLGVAICDSNTQAIAAAMDAGYTAEEQDETLMCIALDRDLPSAPPKGFGFTELDPAQEPYDFQWLLWQGFDHGTDRDEFEKAENIVPQIRMHLNPYLSLTAVNEHGDKVAYCCVWYDSRTDYAYVEPVCAVPAYRGRGITKSLIYEALNRARSLGATCAYVISDMAFYEKLGFKKAHHFTFYRKA